VGSTQARGFRKCPSSRSSNQRARRAQSRTTGSEDKKAVDLLEENFSITIYFLYGNLQYGTGCRSCSARSAKNLFRLGLHHPCLFNSCHGGNSVGKVYSNKWSFDPIRKPWKQISWKWNMFYTKAKAIIYPNKKSVKLSSLRKLVFRQLVKMCQLQITHC